ncbi:MAG: cyclic nucleotide-binding domain-containing protein [Desulfobacterales bacterium]|nr:cyclic nucleotide-binding domain-containing protein [Desulfobacterales bacterium]
MAEYTVLSGNLEFLCLGEILQLLGNNGSSGILRLKSEYKNEPGLIYFKDGDPVSASCGMEKGIGVLYSFFGWTEGDFTFSGEEITDENMINKNRMQLILDGLRMLDDGEIEKIGPVSFEKGSESNSPKKAFLPIIRGPLVDYLYVVEEEDFLAGEKIVEQGKHGGWLWIILEGEVDIFKETESGTIKLLRLGEGAFIGSVASFLFQGNMRSASCYAAGNVHLGVLDIQRLSTEFTRFSPEFREVILSLDRRLKQVSDRSIEVLMGENKIDDYIKDKELVIRQNDMTNRASTITKGEACVVRHTPKGDVPLAILREGDFFGPLPFIKIGHEPYDASVYVSSDLESEPIDHIKLEKEYRHATVTFRNVISNVANGVSVTSMLAGIYLTETDAVNF